MRRRPIVAVLLGMLAIFPGCAKKPLLDTIVAAGTAAEFASFRVDLVDQFGAEAVAPLDTAVQELKIEGIARGVAGTAAREEQAFAAINGKTVREALVLGWQARRNRVVGEIAELTKLLERDLRLQRRAETPARASSLDPRIQNERDIIARLQGDLADAESRLAAWGAPVPPAPADQPAAGQRVP